MPVSRRQFLWLAAIGAAGWPVISQASTPGRRSAEPAPPDPVALAGTTSDPETMTLEAFGDTLIPGQKRFHGDAAISGVCEGPGAVQAGVVEFMRYGPVGVASVLPAFAAGVNGEAAGYIASHHRSVDPTYPPFVALHYRDRYRLLQQVLDHTSGDQQLLWFAFAGLTFLAYHTAGHLPTAEAVRHGHPGLKAIGFPKPDPDGLWRFPDFSYRRVLAPRHPRTTAAGQPA